MPEGVRQQACTLGVSESKSKECQYGLLSSVSSSTVAQLALSVLAVALPSASNQLSGRSDWWCRCCICISAAS